MTDQRKDESYQMGYNDGKAEALSADPCLEKRKAGEPVFVLLARDSAAPSAMETWCRVRMNAIRNGFHNNTDEERDQVRSVALKAEQFRAWRSANR